jgi:hypothetical protein
MAPIRGEETVWEYGRVGESGSPCSHMRPNGKTDQGGGRINFACFSV